MNEETQPGKFKKLFKVFEETLFEINGVLRPGWNFIKDEAAGFRNGWFFCISLTVLVSGLAALFVWWLTNSNWITKHGEALRSQQAELASAKNDRDKCFGALQPWQALASSIYTNVPPSEQLKLLFDQMRAVSNSVVQVLKSSELRFEIFLNGSRVTNDQTIVYLGREPKPLEISVRNIGQTAASKLSIDFFIQLSETNLLAQGWASTKAARVSNGLLEHPIETTVKKVVSVTPIASGSFFSAPPIALTNVSALLLSGRVKVYADGSQSTSVGLVLAVIGEVQLPDL